MSRVRKTLRRLHDAMYRVPVLAPPVRLFDTLHLYWVATERYAGRDAGRDYFERYSGVILPQTHGRVLDLGCGHGYLTQAIARRPAVTEVVGIDKIRTFRCLHAKITYRTQNLARDRRLPGGFDVVVATEFIEHITETAFQALLPNIRDALRPGGTFIGSTPCNPTSAGTFSGSPYHRREYQPAVLEAYLEQWFTHVAIEPHGTAFMTWTASRPEEPA